MEMRRLPPTAPVLNLGTFLVKRFWRLAFGLELATQPKFPVSPAAGIEYVQFV
jgi:hypothetical protein